MLCCLPVVYLQRMHSVLIPLDLLAPGLLMIRTGGATLLVDDYIFEFYQMILFL